MSEEVDVPDFTHAELQAELEEKSKDLQVFVEARQLIMNRVLEVADSSSKLTPLPNWSGTDAVLGSLDLSIHAMERTVEEIRALLKRTPPRPVLTVVRGESDEP